MTPPVYAGVTLPSGGVAVALRGDGTRILLKDGKECGMCFGYAVAETIASEI